MKYFNSTLKFFALALLVSWSVAGIAYATGGGHEDDYEHDEPVQEEIVIPSCPFDAQEGRTIVSFTSGGTHWLLSNKTETEAKLAPVSASLSAGEYAVSLFSYDGYIGRDEVTQSSESWFVILQNGGTEVTRSAAVSDLADLVTMATQNETVNTTLAVSLDVDSVVAYHAAYPSDKKDPNSVAPICAAFDKVPEPEPTLGSITVCKAIIDNEGEVVDGSDFDASTFSIFGIDFAGNTAAPAAEGVIPTSQFSLPLAFNADIFGNDAQCITYGDLEIGSYYYGEEGVDGDGWLTPKYNDQFNTTVNTTTDFSVYSGELFTPDESDDASRNTNADGHIILNENRPNRTLIVLNQHEAVPENVKPVITLIGDDILNIIVNTDFTDPGATAFDEEDGDITEDIVVGGDTVATTTVGTYTITYDVTDSAGASADQVTRTVNVVESGATQCSDEIDNDEDTFVDAEDPACHTDGDAENPDSYDPGIDTENSKPIITLIGTATTTVTVGDDFTDLGATASDEEDGDITEDIVVGGDAVATSTVGIYTITYNVTDSEGLAADEVTRTVSVVELVVPQCSDEVDNDGDELIDAEDPACHTDGDAENPDSYDPNIDDENSKPVLTLVGNATIEIIVNTDFTDPGATAFDEEDGDITEDIVVGGDTVATTTVGTYTITYDVTDSAGASADQVTRTVNVVGGQGGDNEDSTPIVTAVGGNGPIFGGGGGGGIIPTPIFAIASPTTTLPVGTTTPAECTEYLFEYIKLGEENNPTEVQKLEAFLNTFEGFELPVNGVYEQADFAAVGIFQERYFDDVLAPWGHDAATGYVYYTTRKKVNEIYCQRAFPLTGEQSAEVMAFRAFLESLRASGASEEVIEDAISEGGIGFGTNTSTGTELALGESEEGNTEDETLTTEETGITAQFARAFDAIAERVSSKAIGAGLIIIGILWGAIMVYNRRTKNAKGNVAPPKV